MKIQRLTSVFTALILALAFTMSAPAVAGTSDDQAKVDEAFELFWAKRRDIKSYENQKFRKAEHWEVSLNAGLVTNDDFYLFLPTGLGVSYFFSENLGVEFEGSYFVTMSSDLANFLELTDVLGKLPTHEKLVYRATLNALWSPIHGKLGVLTSKLFHYDIHVTGGFGAFGTQVMELDPANETQLKGGAVTPTFAAQVGLGFRFWINEDMAVRAGYRQYFDVSQLGSTTMPAEVLMGFSYFTGGVN
jgi:outer membrane beta-barrel protein